MTKRKEVILISSMDKLKTNFNLYRKILIMAAAAYLIFAAVYRLTPNLNDPMSPLIRLISAGIFLAAYLLSYKSEKVKNKLQIITFFLVLSAILQFIYYTYLQNFKLELAIPLIVIIAVFNLIFRLNLFKFIVNIILMIIIIFSLYFTEARQVIVSLYLTSYILIMTLSFFVSYNIEQSQKRIEKNLKERKIVLDTIDIQIWYLKTPTIYGFANQAHSDFLGLRQQKIENTNLYDFLDEDEAETCEMSNKKVFEQKKKIQTEEWTKNSEGEKRLLSITKTPKLNESAQVEYVVCSAEDITAQKKQREELQYQYKFQKTLAEISSELVNLGVKNIDDKINSALKKIGQFFDIDRSYIFKISEDKKTMSNKYEWTAAGISSQKNRLQNLETEKFKWWLENLKEEEAIVVENVDQLGSGAAPEKELLAAQGVKSLVVIPIFISENLYGFFGFDLVNSSLDYEQGKINQLKIFADVITRAISKHLDNLKIKKLSYYDSLTGLYNRRFFEAELKRLDSKRQLPISIIMADLNGLKIINDSYGHKKGDQMLQKAAEILENSLRKEDILARQGGDEFVILLPQTDQQACNRIMQRIKSQTGIRDDIDLPLSVALGQATKVSPEENIEEIVKKADNQMYENKLSESRSSKSNIVQGLINALDAKSSETKEHAMRMTKLAFDFGEKLNLTESDQNRLSLLATLHDIGKINISEEILNKEDSLTEKEWEIIKKHTEQGYKIASSSDEFAAVAEEIFSHHENWDGSGYPRQLEGKEIPFLARIISLVDAYDVMTNERPYSEAISREEALAEIENCAGSQFDPELADQFIKVLSKK
ncbi:MAG: HD domain-containing phosphohydrolase [bacterium]